MNNKKETINRIKTVVISKKSNELGLSHWNYRVFKYKDGGFGIHETYYDSKGKPNAWTEQPLIVGDSVDELLKILNSIKKDIARFPEIIEYIK